MVTGGQPGGTVTCPHCGAPSEDRVTCTYSTYSITAYADVEVTNNDIDLTSDWEEEDPTILD